eukprot:m.86728 g.86728  ORF g.86728 m.86728 type:complete len:573 (+) comp13069_c0_seq1:234-1952(+)
MFTEMLPIMVAKTTTLLLLLSVGVSAEPAAAPVATDENTFVFTYMLTDTTEDTPLPFWLETTLALNKFHMEYHNRTFHLIRVNNYQEPPMDPIREATMKKQCVGEEEAVENCKNSHRVTHRRTHMTWEKINLVLETLEKGKYEYVMFIDADSYFQTRPNFDPVQDLVSQLVVNDKNVLYANEDWDWRVNQSLVEYIKRTVNTGLILARQSDWTKYYYQKKMYALRVLHQNKNEQLHVRGDIQSNKYNTADNSLIVSGKLYNTNPNYLDISEEDKAHHVHFMGGGKGGLENVDVSKAGSCPHGICLDLDHCLKRDVRKNNVQDTKTFYQNEKSVAYVTIAGLDDDDPARLKQYGVLMSFGKKINATNGAGTAIFMVPDKTVAKYPLKDEERQYLLQHRVQVMEVPWKYPPELHESFNEAATCDDKGLMFLHGLTLTQYKTVVILDPHMRFKVDGNIDSLISCGRQKRFMMSTHPTSPGVISFFPNMKVFDTAITLASEIVFGLKPTIMSVAATSCPEIFMHALYYKMGVSKQVKRRESIQLLDKCIWGRDRSVKDECGKLKCSDAQVHQRGLC